MAQRFKAAFPTRENEAFLLTLFLKKRNDISGKALFLFQTQDTTKLEG
jgi:hypothetical protein